MCLHALLSDTSFDRICEEALWNCFNTEWLIKWFNVREERVQSEQSFQHSNDYNQF